MGVPDFTPAHIPLLSEQRQNHYHIMLGGHNISFSALSIGNPHAVIVVDNVDTAEVHKIGPALESHPLFPQRVNVGFMQIVDRHQFRLRVYERGSGETQACGSGACAAMAAANMLGLLDQRATAHLLGGDLQLSWQGEGKPVMMTGSTAHVYEGEIKL